MDRCDVLVVGGGPAGSSCAWSLARAGLDVRVLDRSQFPRDKTCAGWITPAVLDLLEIDPADYCRFGRVFQPITGFQTSLMGTRGVASCYDHAISFGIRRCEFDDYLLRRSGAGLYLGEPLQSIRREPSSSDSEAGLWVVNERLAAPVLVGAGGHYCPVARYLDAGLPDPDSRGFGEDNIRRDSGLLVAQEVEFEMSARERAGCMVDPAMPELYFCEDLEGYGWCFRKANVLNIGLGRRSGGPPLSAEVARFADLLRQRGRIDFDLPRLRGHAYLVSDQSPRRRLGDGVLLIGDAAGMAYPASGEGIRPAVETGLLAAATIRAAKGRFLARDLLSYERTFVGPLRPAQARTERPGSAPTKLASCARQAAPGLAMVRPSHRHESLVFAHPRAAACAPIIQLKRAVSLVLC